VRYGHDGKYLSRPVALDAVVVTDEFYGVVLEIVLPGDCDSIQETAVLIGAAELHKIAADLYAGAANPGGGRSLHSE
jgi:hypothetical protein